jgi:hypothetical protein
MAGVGLDEASAESGAPGWVGWVGCGGIGAGLCRMGVLCWRGLGGRIGGAILGLAGAGGQESASVSVAVRWAAGVAGCWQGCLQGLGRSLEMQMLPRIVGFGATRGWGAPAKTAMMTAGFRSYTRRSKKLWTRCRPGPGMGMMTWIC